MGEFATPFWLLAAATCTLKHFPRFVADDYNSCSISFVFSKNYPNFD
jgi:hypothetical protein